MNKILPFILASMLLAACQPDEIFIIRQKKNQITQSQQPPSLVAEESKDCPRCEGNTYCNRKTGKCEAQAVSPVKRNETLADKPISVSAFYWQDKGGIDYK